MRASWPLLNRVRNHGLLVHEGHCPKISPMTYIPVNIRYAYQTEPFEKVDHHGGGVRELDEAKKFFTGTEIRPPFTRMWLEWFEENEEGDGPVDCCACLEHIPVSELSNELRGRMKNPLFLTGSWAPTHQRSAWKDQAVLSMFTSPIDLDWFVGDFSRTGHGWTIWPLPMVKTKTENFALMEEVSGSADNYAAECGALVSTALWALLLLSCKNVTLGETHPSERRKDQMKDPLRIIHRELVVDVPPIVRRCAAESDEHGHGVAFHVRRGHFADYTKGKGLFGKHHGRYWIPPTTVGEKAYGEVIKSYFLKGKEL